MRPWLLLGSAKIPPDGEELTLHQRGQEFLIKVDGSLLMNSLTHASEDSLAEIATAKIAALRKPRVLIGGLGMGFTLSAALKRLGPGAEVFVAELVPAVIDWNRGPLSHLAGHPLRDKRVAVLPHDVATILRAERGAYDAILQDVDNGPEGLTRQANRWLYSDAGLAAAAAALRPKGVLAFWSVKPNRAFLKSLRNAGFDAAEFPVRGRDKHRGAHHVVWTAIPIIPPLPRSGRGLG